MRRQARYLKFVLVLFGIGTCAWLAWNCSDYLLNLKFQARQKECIEIINVIGTAESIYYKEFKEYSANLEKIGVSHTMENAQIFFTKDDLPGQYQSSIDQGSFPFIQKDSYQVLAVVKHSDGSEAVFCVMSNSAAAKVLNVDLKDKIE